MRKNCLKYPVEIAGDAFGESPVLADTLKKVTGSDSPRVFLVADINVVQRVEGLGTKIGRYVKTHGIRLVGNPAVLAGGEKIKADELQSAISVMNAMLSAKLGRNDAVLAIGGGTVLDVAGYAAAQVRGGVRLVRIPTTPAAMVDAAFAEYAAVDSVSVKDALRVPSEPAAVVLDPSFAATVLEGVWRGGIGEAIRLAAATDAPLLKRLGGIAPAYRERSEEALVKMLEEVLAARKKHAGTGFAQWAAFRLETMSGYKLPHGYAVGIGMYLDLGYAVERGFMTQGDRDNVVGLLDESRALDGINHSSHLITQPDNLLYGLDAWALSSGSTQIELPAGLGKTTFDAEPDRGAIKKILKEMLSFPAKS
ncbi:MAG: iron-containing alcohol dehydrogenase [Kiritimatiellae bacterium]|nr:iron-containing alcohol dehydrogenase [Kiritimatiellia bacterium]